MAKYKYDPDDPRCQATTRKKTRCKQSAVPGAAVCRFHGGASPQAQRKASERLAELRDAALEKLLERIQSGEITVGDETMPHAVADDVLLKAAGDLSKLVETMEGRVAESVGVDVNVKEAAARILAEAREAVENG